MLDREQIEGFDWDEGNVGKSIDKHQVSQGEVDQGDFRKAHASQGTNAL